ncbi:MAG: SDR family NAD(P)-dependent oxidoreductase, partial [Planctomycetes bacterium]|nr:SDR family NAD(P)-dependent oxidoreductase [Planctomycetota bacterium]
MGRSNGSSSSWARRRARATRRRRCVRRSPTSDRGVKSKPRRASRSRTSGRTSRVRASASRSRRPAFNKEKHLSELFSLRDQVILVTGASRGLGYAMAMAMAQAGGTVILNGREAATLEAAAARLRAAGLKAEIAPFDVSDFAASARAVADIAQRHGRLDVVVLNAGIQHRRPLLEWENADFQRVIDTNLTACFVLAREAVRVMIPQGAGRILMTGSIMGIVARPTVHAYAAAKAGLAGMGKTLAVELAPKGITVNVICP